jgi:hypothetical protein
LPKQSLDLAFVPAIRAIDKNRPGVKASEGSKEFTQCPEESFALIGTTPISVPEREEDSSRKEEEVAKHKASLVGQDFVEPMF